MRRRFDAMRSLLATGLLAASVAGCSNSEVIRDAGNPLVGPTNGITVQPASAPNEIFDLKAKAEEGDA